MLYSGFRAQRAFAAMLLLSVSVVLSASATAGKQAAPVEPSRKHNGSIAGRVVDTSGKPLAKATIILKDSVTLETSTYKSTDNGKYKILNLVPGIYSLQAEANGLQSELITVKVSNDAVSKQELKVERKK